MFCSFGLNVAVAICLWDVGWHLQHLIVVACYLLCKCGGRNNKWSLIWQMPVVHPVSLKLNFRMLIQFEWIEKKPICLCHSNLCRRRLSWSSSTVFQFRFEIVFPNVENSLKATSILPISNWFFENHQIHCVHLNEHAFCWLLYMQYANEINQCDCSGKSSSNFTFPSFNRETIPQQFIPINCIFDWILISKRTIIIVYLSNSCGAFMSNLLLLCIQIVVLRNEFNAKNACSIRPNSTECVGLFSIESPRGVQSFKVVINICGVCWDNKWII